MNNAISTPRFSKISTGEYRIKGTKWVVRKDIDADERPTGEWQLLIENSLGEFEWHETYGSRKEAAASIPQVR